MGFHSASMGGGGRVVCEALVLIGLVESTFYLNSFFSLFHNLFMKFEALLFKPIPVKYSEFQTWSFTLQYMVDLYLGKEGRMGREETGMEGDMRGC